MYYICIHVHVQIYSTARAELVHKHQVGALGAVFDQWPTTYNHVQAMEKYSIRQKNLSTLYRCNAV